MPPAEDIQRSLAGVWRMMAGRRDGLQMLDLSVDGFWNSFFAIVLGLPAMLIGWVTLAHDMTLFPDIATSRLSAVLRLAAVDLGTWIAPILVLAYVARPVGIADRFVPYVVASNWSAAIFVWIMLPPSLVRLLWPEAGEAASAVSLLLFLGTLVLSWRVTNEAIARGPAVATSVFAAMFALSLAVLFALQSLFGVVPPA